MDLQERINLMSQLGDYLLKKETGWKEVSKLASHKNGWFIEDFINNAADEIATQFLQRDKLQEWAAHYHLNNAITPVNVGIVMAGNIPLVGFHDMLTCFICGHNQTIKLSSKDDVLLPHLVNYLISLNPAVENKIKFADILKNCDAYIATGSNNTGKYFEQYFGKYPNIIRKNKTSVAVLDGTETETELKFLSDDVNLYFGLGCRNVTHIYVPENYNFEALLNSFNAYSYFADHHKYKNNYDYQLSLLLLNHQYYMTNGSVLLSENKSLFSPISHLFFSYYKKDENLFFAEDKDNLQCIVGHNYLPIGEAQAPGLFEYADGVDTMQFLLGL